MAKGGKVEIEVELTGVQESEKELAGLTESGAAVGETFTSILSLKKIPIFLACSLPELFKLR